MFAVQEEIAKEVSQKLRLKLTGAEEEQLAKRPTEISKAFQDYMQGRAAAQRRTNADLHASVELFRKALQEDSKYALAYAGLSDAYANLGYYGSIAPIEGRREGKMPRVKLSSSMITWLRRTPRLSRLYWIRAFELRGWRPRTSSCDRPQSESRRSAL